MAYWGAAGRVLIATRGGHLPDANPGMATAAELLERYESRLGSTAGDVAFFEAMATAKLAVICAGSLHRNTEQSEERRAQTWRTVTSLADIAAATIAS